MFLKHSFLWYFFLSLCYTLHGQVCEGNLGDNIFINGDFGRGSANIPRNDPQIAPGYNYATQGPPPDGSYLITNNTGPWADRYGWLHTRDNSPDPNGYMMIVNASYTPGIFYEEEITGLCPNTFYEFSADIFNLIPRGRNIIKPNIDFLLDSVVQYQTGDIPENESWVKYGFTFTTGSNQESVKLSLRNNAPGGGGNDLALDNISFRACGSQIAIFEENLRTKFCSNDNTILLQADISDHQYTTPLYEWQMRSNESSNWETLPNFQNSDLNITLDTGRYQFRIIFADGQMGLANEKCRITSDVYHVYIIPDEVEIAETICADEPLTYHNKTYAQSGVYRVELQNSLGCDSIVLLHLNVIETQYAPYVIYEHPRCHDEASGIIRLVGTSPSNLHLILQDKSGKSLDNLPPARYNVRVEDEMGCGNQIEVILENPDPFHISLEDDYRLELGETVNLDPTASEPIDVLLCEFRNEESICDFVFSPIYTGDYFFSAQNSRGCLSNKEKVFVEVYNFVEISTINVIDPNSETNKFFYIKGDSNKIDYIEQLIIADRWGNILYNAQNSVINLDTQGWDGRIDGSPANSGVYIYQAIIVLRDGSRRLYSGEFTVL